MARISLWYDGSDAASGHFISTPWTAERIPAHMCGRTHGQMNPLHATIEDLPPTASRTSSAIARDAA